MSRQRNELHLQQVEAWKKLNQGLSSEEMNQLLIKAISALRLRSLKTLSNVTVTAVTDRTIRTAKENFSILSDVSSDDTGIHFGPLLDQLTEAEKSEAQVALQDFLIELLDVFGKITAEILTKYLHQELMTVTLHTVVTQIDPSKKPRLGIVKNREKK